MSTLTLAGFEPGKRAVGSYGYSRYVYLPEFGVFAALGSIFVRNNTAYIVIRDPDARGELAEQTGSQRVVEQVVICRAGEEETPIYTGRAQITGVSREPGFWVEMEMRLLDRFECLSGSLRERVTAHLGKDPGLKVTAAFAAAVEAFRQNWMRILSNFQTDCALELAAGDPTSVDPWQIVPVAVECERCHFRDLSQTFEQAAADVPEELVPEHIRRFRRPIHALTRHGPMVEEFANWQGHAGNTRSVAMLVESRFLAPEIRTNARDIVSDVALPLFSDAMHSETELCQGHRIRVFGMGPQIVENVVHDAFGGHEPIVIRDMLPGPGTFVRTCIRRAGWGHRVRAEFVSAIDEARPSEDPLAICKQFAAEDLGSEEAVAKRCSFESCKFTGLFSKMREGGPVACASALGIADYLDDRTVVILIKRLYRTLLPGGVAMVSNVHSSNPLKYSMAYAFNWVLFLRTCEEMRQLAISAGVPSAHIAVYRDTKEELPPGTRSEDLTSPWDPRIPSEREVRLTGTNMILACRKPKE